MGSFDGQNPSKTDILVKYTYYGDANLDGQADAGDYSLIDNGYLNHLTGRHTGISTTTASPTAAITH